MEKVSCQGNKGKKEAREAGSKNTRGCATGQVKLRVQSWEVCSQSLLKRSLRTAHTLSLLGWEAGHPGKQLEPPLPLQTPPACAQASPCQRWHGGGVAPATDVPPMGTSGAAVGILRLGIKGQSTCVKPKTQAAQTQIRIGGQTLGRSQLLEACL